MGARSVRCEHAAKGTGGGLCPAFLFPAATLRPCVFTKEEGDGAGEGAEQAPGLSL